MRQLAISIEEYFRRSGAEVRAECLARSDGRTILALIDSEPQPRFRYSHIIEIGLRNHLRRLHGVELARVYWRFVIREMSGLDAAPMPAAKQPALPPHAIPRASSATEDRELEEDTYLNLRRLREKLGQEYQVDDASWENYIAAQDDADRPRKRR